MKSRLITASLLFLLLLISGCATNSMTGRSQLILVSEQSAINTATSAYTSMMGGLDKKGAISTDEALNTRVQSITDRLITQAVRYRPDTAQWAWSVKVIQDPNTLNAFCMPGGKMAIYTGLIEKLDATDDEIAQVMGHEISHAIANHGAEKMSNQILANAIVAGVSAAARSNTDRQMRQDVGSVAALVFINLPNSRTAEEEADRLGIELSARAGYDPAAAVSLWNKMMNASGNKSKFDFLSTHPAPPKRIEALEAMQGPMNALYAESKLENPAVRKWTSLAPNETEVRESTSSGTTSLTDTSSTLSVVTTSATTSLAPPGQSQPLAFYSKEFEQFKAGESELNCTDCTMSFVLKQGAMREKYEKGSWRDLAMDTLKIGYRLDLAYFYLGKAAIALGFVEPGKKYLRQAQTYSESKDSSCSQGFLVKCGGIDVKAATASAMAGL